jgi:hypothetical protein
MCASPNRKKEQINCRYFQCRELFKTRFLNFIFKPYIYRITTLFDERRNRKQHKRRKQAYRNPY